VLQGLLNENISSCYGVHLFPPKKSRGQGVHIQSNLRSKGFEDISGFMRRIEPSDLKENP
jgi:hypothetical protein